MADRDITGDSGTGTEDLSPVRASFVGNIEVFAGLACVAEVCTRVAIGISLASELVDETDWNYIDSIILAEVC